MGELTEYLRGICERKLPNSSWTVEEYHDKGQEIPILHTGVGTLYDDFTDELRDDGFVISATGSSSMEDHELMIFVKEAEG